MSDSVVPQLDSRSWAMLASMFGDLADGVDVDIEFTVEMFGSPVEVVGDFEGFVVAESGDLLVRVTPRESSLVYADRGVLVPMSSVTGWEVR